MALFNRYIVKDFTKERYLEIVRAHPAIGEEKTQIYAMLILTFLSLSFLGLVAINPTLVTIVELNKKLDDSSYVSTALKTKIENLSSLRMQYDSLVSSWPLTDAAVPNNPEVINLLGQVHAIAKNTNVQLEELQSFTVGLTKPLLKRTALPMEASFVFSVSAVGKKENLLDFVQSLTNFNRIAAVESVNYTNEEKESVTVRLRVFFAR